MKIHTQPSSELTQIGELIQPMDTVAMLTTQAADGELTSRPMAPLEMDSHGALWFFTDARSAKVEQLRTVNLAFSDSERGTYVSMSGHGDLESDRAHIQRLWSPMLRPWFPDGPESADLRLLKFTPGTVEYWDAAAGKMVRMMAIAASVIAARPIGMGEHGRVNVQ